MSNKTTHTSFCDSSYDQEVDSLTCLMRNAREAQAQAHKSCSCTQTQPVESRPAMNRQELADCISELKSVLVKLVRVKECLEQARENG